MNPPKPEAIDTADYSVQRRLEIATALTDIAVPNLVALKLPKVAEAFAKRDRTVGLGEGIVRYSKRRRGYGKEDRLEALAHADPLGNIAEFSTWPPNTEVCLLLEERLHAWREEITIGRFYAMLGLQALRDEAAVERKKISNDPESDIPRRLFTRRFKLYGIAGEDLRFREDIHMTHGQGPLASYSLTLEV